jgi:ParB family transcriptional regulator, chromosome partitioning protein
MHLDHIDLSKLVVSTSNMRAKRKDRDIDELIPSVRARGILVPLLVRPNGEPDTFEIVAGRRRYFAAKAVAEADGTAPPLPCAVMAPGDDAAALEASLLENVARLDADEVTQWETFARLVKQGRSVEDIAATFGLGERVVRRVLALGNLVPRIRTLYRTEQISAATMRHLTLATPAHQREWLALFDSPDQHAPTGRLLKEWLFGGAAIQTTSALFDVSEYTAPIVGDLFEDHQYFSDSALFWALQTKSIAARAQAYAEAGWSDVVVIGPDGQFNRWEYEKRSQAKGGRVYIVAHVSGEVEFFEGYLPRKEAKRADRIEAPTLKATRSELSSPLRRYVDLHRHALTRAELLNHPWVALRLLLAHIICGSQLWRVRCERQWADKAETRDSVAQSQAQATFEERRNQVLARLGGDEEASSLVDGCHGSLSSMFEALLALSDEEVLSIVPIVMGETLEAGGQAIETVGTLLRVEPRGAWHADEAFIALLRDRQVLLTIVAELAGPEAARANKDASGKVLKSIIHDCLTGTNGRPKVENWAPRWLTFPASTYLANPDPDHPSAPA